MQARVASHASTVRVGDLRVAMLHYGVGTEHVYATLIDEDGSPRSTRLAAVEQVAQPVERLSRMLRAPTRYPPAAARRQAEAAEDYRRARLVIATVAELHLRTGNAAAAERALQEIRGDQASTSDYEQLTSARLLTARGRPALALDALAGIEARAVSEGRDGSLVAIFTISALARAALGGTAAARDLLVHAVELAAPDGYRRTFLDQGAPLMTLLGEVRSTAPDFVADLLTRSTGARSTGAPGAPGHPRTPSRRTAQLRTGEGITVVETLTDTQQRILGLIATGMSNQQVADKLFITVGTTKWHLNQIFGRLQARNRTEAVARARQLNLLWPARSGRPALTGPSRPGAPGQLAGSWIRSVSIPCRSSQAVSGPWTSRRTTSSQCGQRATSPGALV